MSLRHFFLLRRQSDAPWPAPGPGWRTAEAGNLLAGWQGDGPNVAVGDVYGPLDFSALAAGDVTAAARLDGAFAVLAFDASHRRAAVITDRFGLHPVYTAERGGLIGWSTSLLALASLLGLPRQVDADAAAEMLVLHMPLADRCLLSGAKTAAPASVLRVDEAGATATEYWRWDGLKEVPAEEGELLRPTFALIEAAIMRAVPAGAKVALPLSGGLDSRMLAAVMVKNGVRIQAYNIDFGREAEIARQVADTLGIPLTTLPMLGRPESVPEAHASVDGAYHLNQMWGQEMARRAAEDGCDVLTDGLAFDAILGAVFQCGPGDEALATNLEANFSDVTEPMLARQGGAAYAQGVFGRVRAGIAAEARAAVAQAGPRASEHFVMRNRVRKYTFGYCLANERPLPGRFPYITRELFEHCLRLPVAAREEHRLYRRIYRELFPALARIPWAKTGLPLDQYGSLEPSRWWLTLSALVRRLSFGWLAMDGRGSFSHMVRTEARLRAVYEAMWRLPSPGLEEVLPEAVAARAVSDHLTGHELGGLVQAVATVKHFQALLCGREG
jgi:hypothetical protein